MENKNNNIEQNSEETIDRQNEEISDGNGKIASTTLATAGLVGAIVGTLAGSTPVLGTAAIAAGSASLIRIVWSKKRKEKQQLTNEEN